MLGAYRFMNNHHVRYEQVQQRLTSNWPGQDKRLICIQDASEANYSSHSGALSIKDPDIGPLSRSTDAGFFMHPSLWVDLADGFVLGAAALQPPLGTARQAPAGTLSRSFGC